MLVQVHFVLALANSMRYKYVCKAEEQLAMQITNYAQLLQYISSNTAFAHAVATELSVAQAMLDFVLADAQLCAIAATQHNETDVSILHEFVLDDVLLNT
jgi:hypothetical protein